MAKFGEKVAKAQALAKERKAVTLSALAVELEVSFYYARTIAKAAVDLDKSLTLGQLWRPAESEQDPWTLYDKAWLEAEQARLTKEE
jgi:hypothetical protein